MKTDIIRASEDAITPTALKESAANLVPTGSVLIVTRSGILQHTLPVAKTEIEVAINQDLKAITPHEGVDPDYLAYAFRRFGEQILRGCSKSGTTVASVVTARLKAFGIPLAPHEEQRRIVHALDTQLTRLDTAVGALKRLKANLARYRASLLKAACEGRLVPTEAEFARRQGWEYEHAEVLLERVLAERQARWEAAGLDKLKAKGRTPTDNRLKKKYKEPPGPETSQLPELPEGWVWATVDQLAAPEERSLIDGPFGSKLKTAHYTESGPRVVRLQNIGDGKFVDERAHITESHFSSLEQHRVFAGDLVIASLGSAPPRSAIVPEGLGPAIVKADCIRFKPANQVLHAQYANIVLNAEPTKNRMAAVVHGVGRPRLGLANIRKIPIPLPPYVEQERIVAEYNALQSRAECVQDEVAQTLTRAEKLRQVILKRAFEGRLVSQDPNDEPASVLLKRIRKDDGRMQVHRPALTEG